MVSKKSKKVRKSKTRPPRIFIKGKKLFIQIGKKKVLLKDADKYKKSDIIEILLKQLLVKRKYRSKGKITKRERKLNREDLRIFNEFENMNRNQSKGTLKLPTTASKTDNKQAEFYNAMLSFLKTTPTRDINVEVKKQLDVERKRVQQEQETARNLLQQQQQALNVQQRAAQGRDQAQQQAQAQREQQQELQVQQQQQIEREEERLQQERQIRLRDRREREFEQAQQIEEMNTQRNIEESQQRQTFLERAIARREALDDEERKRQQFLNQQERDLQREINQQELENRLTQQAKDRKELSEMFKSGVVEYRQEQDRKERERNRQQPNLEPLLKRMDEMAIDIEAKQNLISKQSQVAILQSDMLKIDKSNNKREVKRKLKGWVDSFEQSTGTTIDYGTVNNRPKVFSKASTRDIFESIIKAYGGLDGVNSSILLNDYMRFRPSIVAPMETEFQMEQKTEQKIEQKTEPTVTEPPDLPPPLETEPPKEIQPPEEKAQEIIDAEEFLRQTEQAMQNEPSGTDADDESSDLSEFSSGDISSGESSDEDLANVASQILGQIGDGNSYTGAGLNTQEIDKMLKPILKKQYIGTLPADFNKFLPDKLPKKFGFVMNTDPSNKEGKHWVAVIVDLKNDMSVEYFDSFGQSPNKKFMKEIKKLIDKLKPNTYLKMKINNVKHQDDRSQNCGFFSVKFLIDRLKNGLTFKEATKFQEQPDLSQEGENNINELKNKFGYI